ncbi:hypothetical protein [Tunturiibacter gelidiferens]|uniref:hypothetical protein n=1 Tax=Tunturiibacter gelidiferens TaxID=3069689 RepID=UPI003D9B2E0B
MKLNRRKYDALIKFLREMMATAKSERVRMQAAERLDGIYARHELAEQEALRRQDRIELRRLKVQAESLAEAQRLQERAITEQVSTSEKEADERTREMFSRFMNPKEKTNDGADATE